MIRRWLRRPHGHPWLFMLVAGVSVTAWVAGDWRTGFWTTLAAFGLLVA